MRRKTILRSFQSPGDVLMLTAAVRDLHLANPGQFLTDVRTSAAALWENNPHLTPLNECEPGVETIDCHYPLIHQSNARPYHFIHGYAQFLEARLGVKIPLTRFAGEIHLSAKEQNRPLPFADLGLREGFWIVMAGGKYDFTAKWWDPAAYQAVIDHFQGRIQFAQCGEAGHFHPPLERVINLVGKTILREFVVLMHHAAGVLCPVTFAMHLAAAVPMRAFDSVGNALRGVPRGAVGTAENGVPGLSRRRRDGLGRRSSQRLRPCVVVAGGREPAHWEQYPGHQFLHTIGALDCCATGGCWKSRCQLVGDGDEKDRRDVCERPVQITPELRIAKCMATVTPDDVVRAIERYLECGDSSPLSLVAERPSLVATFGAAPPGGSGAGALVGVPPVHSVGSALGGVPSTAYGGSEKEIPPALTPTLSRRERETKAAPRQKKAAMNRTHSKVLIDFRHGLGDTVQLTTVLLHLRHYHPDWQIDVACGIGKLPQEKAEGGRQKAKSERRAPALYDRLFVRGHDTIDRAAYQRVFELAWEECPTCYADSPATKAEYCLRTVFKLEPIPELCRYELTIGQKAMAEAKMYLESICVSRASASTNSDRFPVVLLHYQANTSTDKKDLPHELAGQVCETAIKAGYVPVILDWDKRSPLPDGVRIFNPGADHPLWGGIGTGDTEVLAALIEQASLFIGVDSGPLHVAGALSVGDALCGIPPVMPGNDNETRRQGNENPGTPPELSRAPLPAPHAQSPTPVLAIWTGHHPLHYFGLAEHVTHLVPEDYSSRLRGNATAGLAFFEKHYHHRVHQQIAFDLPALVACMLSGEPFDQARNKCFLRTLRATGYTEDYYLEHQRAGLDYLTFGEWQRQYGRWLVDSLALRAKRVLDVGCACGSILCGLAEAGSAAEGVDLCEAMIRRGRDARPNMASLLHVCDAVNLHLFDAGAFDAIHSAQVAEHWRPELVPFILRELARVTVPGGLLFCALDTEELFARQGRSMDSEDPTHICVRPLSWWHERLAETGWEICTAEYAPRLRAHPENFLARYDWDWFVARKGRSGSCVHRREATVCAEPRPPQAPTLNP